MGIRMIRLVAAASIFACALAAGMAPVAAASTEDPAGTAEPAVQVPPPVEVGEEPAADPTPLIEPPPDEPPPADEDPGSVETIEPLPTDSLPADTPPGDTTGTAGDAEAEPPADVVVDAPPSDTAPPADSPPGETPAADPPRVVVEGIVPEPPAVALVEPDVTATGPAVRAPSAPKPAAQPRSTGSAHSLPADPPAAEADLGTTRVALARARRPDPSPDSRFDPVAAAGAGFMAGLAVTGRAQSTIAVAVEFGRAGGGWAGALVFNIWLRRQLRERRMSQRQLAALSGVDHSTISRLLSEDRRPSLATATKLVEALGHVRGEQAESLAADYFQRMPEETIFPARRVELALRADEALDEEEIRRLMSMYLRARQRNQLTSQGSVGRSPAAPAPAPATAEPRR